MSYLNRQPAKQTSSAELLSLLVVLVAGVATAWWAGHKIGMDLSSVTTAARLLGFVENGRPARGYAPNAAAEAAGVRVISAVQPASAEAAPTAAPAQAAYCNPGQAPAFVHGFADLKSSIGDVMGTPVECEHPASADGDTVQKTTTGLAAYRKSTNTVTFTDGWRHWALNGRGVVSWEGSQADPPAQ